MKKEVILISVLFLVLTLLISGCKPEVLEQATEEGIKKTGLEAGSGFCKGFPVTKSDITTIEKCSDVPTTNSKNKCKALISEDESYCANFKKSSTSTKSEEDQRKIFGIECKAAANRDPSICEQLKDLNAWTTTYESSGYISTCKGFVCDFGLV